MTPASGTLASARPPADPQRGPRNDRPRRPPRLSKSRLLDYLQCPKRLWLQAHRPEAREESAEMHLAFANGHEVGEAARALVPGGVLIEPPNNDPMQLGDVLEAQQREIPGEQLRGLFTRMFAEVFAERRSETSERRVECGGRALEHAVDIAR